MIYFKDCKYTNWYYRICWRGQTDRNLEYYEKHHIFPRCLGGDNDPLNITKLTAREHFIVHWLLVKMGADSYVYHKMNNALGGFTRRGKKRVLTSKEFDRARKACVEWARYPRSQETREKLRKNKLGSRQSEESKRKISLKKTGVKQDPKVVERRAKSNKDNWTSDRREFYSKNYGGRNKRAIMIGNVRYNSVREAARELGLTTANLYRKIRNKHVIAKYQ